MKERPCGMNYNPPDDLQHRYAHHLLSAFINVESTYAGCFLVSKDAKYISGTQPIKSDHMLLLPVGMV
jgi:hypothetical protein